MKKSIIAVTTAALVSSLAVTSVDAASYRVKSGDTLSGIAYEYNTSVSKLKSWNDLTSDMIYVNQVLEVSAATSSSAKTYTVQSGDYLSKIGQKFDVYVAELKEWNNLSSDVIYPGQVLKVSASGDTTTQPKPSANGSTYTVQSGDTLSHIAARYDVSVSQIKSWNGLKTDTIYVGQKLSMGGSTSDGGDSSQTSNVVDTAKKYIGTPYKWGGTTPSGFDCSGFIYYVFNQAGTSISRTNTEGYYSKSTAVSNPKPGDLVFFKNTYKSGISHMGIYVGNGEFVHASDSGVVVSKLTNPYWSPRFAGYRTF